MTRPLRIEYPDAFYHITSRGNERRVIFRNREDREKFISFLQSASERYQALIALYCLMDNHYHLLLETPLGNLSAILHHINAGYTSYFNRKHGRVGHLFQGRFKAILVEKDVYALELSRYIHLNPVRAAIVKRPEDYPWSSYRIYIGKEKGFQFLETNTVLAYFGKDRGKARVKYRQFVEEGLKRGVKNPLESVTASTILGGERFIEWAKEKFLIDREEGRDIPTIRALLPRPSVEKVMTEVKKAAWNSKLAREISLYLLHRYSGLKLKEIGKLFGELGESGVSQNTQRLEERMKGDRKLETLIKKIRTKLM